MTEFFVPNTRVKLKQVVGDLRNPVPIGTGGIVEGPRFLHPDQYWVLFDGTNEGQVVFADEITTEGV